MFNTPKQKRDQDQVSPNGDSVLPPVKIIRWSPKERGEEIECIIEEYVHPINRELMENQGS